MRRRLYKYHPVIGYLKMPSRQFRIHFSDGVFRYRTNAAGFRGDGEFSKQKTDLRPRVLVFGDSFTEGGCVADGDRYTDFLRRSLDIDFYNFGISGTGTDQQYLIHREVGAAYEHDLVVVGIWVENIRRNTASSRIHADQNGRHHLTPKPYFTLGDDGVLALQNQPVPRPLPLGGPEDVDGANVDPGTLGRQGIRGQAAEMITRLGPRPKRLVQRVTRWQPLPEYDDPQAYPWRLMRAILEHWAAESTVPVLVVPIPIYQYVEQTAPSDAVRARFQELSEVPNLIVHDPLPDLWTYTKRERQGFRFPTDHHFTPTGHAALARSLEPVIRDLVDSTTGLPTLEGIEQ